eukprot:2773888-Pyramimonas_sp.AAC.1
MAPVVPQPSGRRWSNDIMLSSSQTPLPFGELYTPPPLPRVWTGGSGVIRGPSSAQDGSKRASGAPR